MGFVVAENTGSASKRVAVVGSGLAGLTAAHLLHKSGCAVELFERSSGVGMDLGSVTVEGVRVDVPFRVFTPDYYPYLYMLYRYLGISFAAADYSLGFAHDSADDTVWSYTNMPLEDFQMSVPDGIVGSTTRLAVTREWVRLAYACLRLMRTRMQKKNVQKGADLGEMTIGEYLLRERYEAVFVDQVFVPFIASLLTCSLEAAAAYPADTILNFTAKVVFGARIRKAKNGVQEVCEALTRGLDAAVHLATPITAIVLDDNSDDNDNNGGSGTGGVCLVSADGERRWFDDVVLATPADVAATLLETARDKKHSQFPPSALVRALRAVPYEDTHVLTHRDESVMPKRRSEWRGVNIRTESGGANAMASHWINYVEQTTSGRSFSSHVFQTVDPLVALDKSKVISVSAFRRSLVTVESQRQINTLSAHQGQRGVWFVGSYAAPGVPLLEGCVRSAVDVVRALGVRVPFHAPQLVRRRSNGSEYAVGLAPGMMRDEVVEAYFESDPAGTFAFDSSRTSCSGAGVSQWAAWLAFFVLLPVLSLALAVVDAVLSAVLGADLGSRVQMAALDALVFGVCVLQLGYRRLLR
ncbi:hypothetical protein H4S06_003020 [Coemansia sp. BCRC 34490]|nr:hypothetical protein H4S06_003020 [Coemansia sp. BCRC 34490]